jgi:hypothetical protein
VGTGEVGVRARRDAGAGAWVGGATRAAELLPAVGEIDDHGGEGRSPSGPGGRKPDAGGESERAAERRIPAESGGVRTTAGGAPEGGRGQYGAWREGTHDDLVFAVALACWAAEKTDPRPPERYWSRGDIEVKEWERKMRAAVAGADQR